MPGTIKNDNKITLGVAAISYNEERDLPGFIEHLIKWVDEIIIVDDGSTDKTEAIAKGYGNKVKFITNKMAEKDFGGQRNIGINNATADWLLHMDIDERVTPELAKEILNAISDTTKNGFKYRRLNFFLHRPMKGGGWQTWNHAQLGRRGYHQFQRKLHEQCIIEGGEKATGQLNGYMWHFNDTDYSERMRKSFQYSHMEADKIISANKKIRWYHFISMPALRFLKLYFYKKGFRDGTLGLLASLHSMDAEFRACALAWDRQNRISRSTLETQFADKWKGFESPVQQKEAIEIN